MRRILKNILASWMGLVATALVGFFLTPFILHQLGNTGYGLWVLVSAFTGYYGILDFGLRSALLRYVARHAARDEWQELSSVVSTTLVAYSLVGILVLLITALVTWRFDLFFHVDPKWVHSARLLVVVVGIGTALAIPL